jgi:type VI protein secretion system component Hcp
MKSMRRAVFMIVPALWAWQASGAPLSARTPSAASPATATAPSGPTRPAPAAHLAAPYKPIELSNPVSGLAQSTVRWKIPDQSNGRLIAQWLVRACPKVDGTPYAACQQVQQLGGPNGQSSGTYVQAQIPAHVIFMGANTPVNGAEICSANSVATSCADRIAVRFVNPGIAPAPRKLQGAAPSGMPLGTAGIRAAPVPTVAKQAKHPKHPFIRVSGVSGDSKDNGHEGWIDLLTMQYQESHGSGSGVAPSGGRGCREVKLSVTKLMDKTSSQLANLMTLGRSVDVTIDGIEGRQELRQAIFTSVVPLGGHGSDVGTPQESISLRGTYCSGSRG